MFRKSRYILDDNFSVLSIEKQPKKKISLKRKKVFMLAKDL